MERGDNSSLSESSSDQIRQSKKSKTASSPSEATTSASSLSSKMTNNFHLNNLPDSLLVEILCRLPCFKFLYQCKCVSKRWRSLISDPYFTDRFQPVQIGSLISATGEELLNRISNSSAKLLTPLFRKLMSFFGWKEEPIVLGTYNDLVLCGQGYESCHHYYICNPYTTQWVSVPPAPEADGCMGLGFICDLPYYNCRKEGEEGDINDGYRCRVVRIVTLDGRRRSPKVKLQIFSFETGKWIESILSTPSVGFKWHELDRRGFAYNGMLYWEGSTNGTSLIGLDPFLINRSYSTINDIDYSTGRHKFRIIQIDGGVKRLTPSCLGVYGGCLRTFFMEYVDDHCNLLVWDLNEEDDEFGRLAIHGGAVQVKLQLENTTKVFPLDGIMSLQDETEYDDYDMHDSDLSDDQTEVLGSDLSNEDILYLHTGRYLIECNIRTQEWSKIAGKRNTCNSYYPIVQPRWPTPVPELPQHAADPYELNLA